jgi:hypothetical protein
MCTGLSSDVCYGEQAARTAAVRLHPARRAMPQLPRLDARPMSSVRSPGLGIAFRCLSQILAWDWSRFLLFLLLGCQVK